MQELTTNTNSENYKKLFNLTINDVKEDLKNMNGNKEESTEEKAIDDIFSSQEAIMMEPEIAGNNSSDKDVAPHLNVNNNTKVDVEEPTTSTEPVSVPKEVIEECKENEKKIDTLSNDIEELKLQARNILKSDFKNIKKSNIRKYPKKSNRKDKVYAYYNEDGYKPYKSQEKYAKYNAIIDKLNELSNEKKDVQYETQQVREKELKTVEQDYDEGKIELTEESAKEVAKMKCCDVSTYENPVEEEDTKDVCTQSNFVQEQPQNYDLQEKIYEQAQNSGTVVTDLETSRNNLKEIISLLNEELQKPNLTAEKRSAYLRQLDIVKDKYETVTFSLEEERKANERYLDILALNKAQQEQESKGIDSLVINGKTYQCKASIITENDWKDLTNSLDKALLDSEEGTHSQGYCTAYNTTMLRRLITHYVIRQFGNTKNIKTVYVQDLNLYINNTLVLYKGTLFSEKSEKRIPRDVLPYLKNGMLAPFFDWGVFYLGANCGGRPLNLKELYFSDVNYVRDYFSSDLASLEECKYKKVVQSPYGYMCPSLYFSLFKNLVQVTIGDDSYDRKSWEEHKYDDKDSYEVKRMKSKMRKERRKIDLLDGYKLNVYAGTNAFQEFGIKSFTSYVTNRGNRGFLRHFVGSSFRFMLASAGILTNFTSHLIGGTYKTLKGRNDYEWNDSIKDKMEDTNVITEVETNKEIEDAKKEARKNANT